MSQHPTYYVITNWDGEVEVYGPCSKQAGLDLIKALGHPPGAILVKEVPIELVAVEEE